MKLFQLRNMIRGWFVGQFEPSVYQTTEFEVGVKNYRQGEKEAWHYHKIAREITLVVSGEVEMCKKIFKSGDIISLDPGEGTEFRAVTDAVTVVVKVPSVPGDKYLGSKDSLS